MGEIAELDSLFKHFNYLVGILDANEKYGIKTNVVKIDDLYVYAVEKSGRFSYGNWLGDVVYWDPANPEFIFNKHNDSSYLGFEAAGELLLMLQADMRRSIKEIEVKKREFEEREELERLYHLELSKQASFYNYTTGKSLPVTMPSASPEES